MIRDADVYDGLARWLHQAKLATYTDVGPGTAPQLHIRALRDTPDHAIALAIYDRDTQRAGTGNPDVYVQVRCRAPGPNPRQVLQAADDIAAALDDAAHLTLPNGLHVIHARRVVTTPVEDAANHRLERADSYRLHLAA